MNKIKFGEVVFDKKLDKDVLNRYSPFVIAELFTSISYFIGLGIKEFSKIKNSIPQWCFNDLFGEPDEKKLVEGYSNEERKQAYQYFIDKCTNVSNLFLDFIESDEKQDDVDKMLDELKKIFLSLWI